jgi:hypothetical protein
MTTVFDAPMATNGVSEQFDVHWDRSKKERHLRASEERHPPEGFSVYCFLLARISETVSFFVSFRPGEARFRQWRFFHGAWQFGNSTGALTRLAAFLGRRAAEPYYAIGCSVPSGAPCCSRFGPKSWLDGRDAALVKLVHHSIE